VEAVTDFFYQYDSISRLVLINCLLALSAYVSFSCGQFSVATPGFMALGAYTAALLTLTLHWPFMVVLGAAIAVPALVAFLFGLPLLKLKGVYLAMATLGFVEVVHNLAINMTFTGGAMGLMGIKAKTEIWHLILALAACIYLLWVIENSKLGAGLKSMAKDWQLARVLGVPLVRYNLIAFVLSAAIAGLAGGLSAHSSNAIIPGDFGFGLVIAILSFTILGGVDRLWGPILGALFLSILPEVARPFQEYRLIFTGALLLLAILFLKRGLAGFVEQLWRLAWPSRSH